MKVRICPNCKGRATKIINISNGSATCQQCHHTWSLYDAFTEHQRKAGQVTSERKKIASAENGRKGGRPKGSKNKPKPTPEPSIPEITRRKE